MDTILQVKEMAKIGETIFAQNVEEACGGKGANQAVAVGKLGGNVTMLGVVGNDSSGEKLLNNLRDSKVVINKIHIDKKQRTGSAYISIDSKGQNSIIVSKGANECCDVAYLKSCEAEFEQADLVLISMEIPQEAVELAAMMAKKHHCYCILNPAPAPESLGNLLLSKVDLLTPNETELEHLTGACSHSLESIQKGCEKLIALGIPEILVTLGEKGALYVTKEKAMHFQAYQVNAVDTTAAGDSFNGAITVSLSEGNTMEAAIQFANLVSSIAVTKKGAQASIPTRLQVEEWKASNHIK